MSYDPNTEHALIIADLRQDDAERDEHCASVESDAAYLLGGNDAMAGRPARPPTGWEDDYAAGYDDNKARPVIAPQSPHVQTLLFQ